ncbi:hypothetical protein DMO17_02570 [Aquipseudomonas alcaligenes]|uniref:Uncharacterized protein n=1 Tax=Aquipseudomonas alcaligenes TaxID=43263 RepID=A0A2V4L9E8_AQUAC|nr:hypothetical protein [Pseudomonas alcaligenes]PYC29599.1 hypothetical protein DMO17_02570 [Pseudomonas alcaligenes]
MEDLSLAALKSLILANQLLTAGIISLLVSALVVWRYWEQVSYFLIRVWHSFPLIGTVARLSRKPASVDSDGWINHEVTLANVYYREFKKYMRGPEAYNASLDYLAKAGEAGRSPRPAWVLFLVMLLVLVEAMGFAYVLAGWMNLDASTNDRHLLTAGTAILLAVASAIFAEAAGHTVHHNSLIARARHWWQGEEPSKRSRTLKAAKAINLEESFSDSDKPDYEQLLARVKDVNSNVSRKYLWLVICGAFVACMAVGAFMVRSATLDSIETEMINSMKAEASLQSDSSIGSPFDLPEESQAINDEAENATIEDKMEAIRQASLTTYVMLSLIYIAIQGISIWLASKYYFAGTHSFTAWRLTHEYATAEEMMDAMDQHRTAIASHADDKLRRLQTLLSSRDQTNSGVLSALEGENSAHRNFLAYIEYKAGKVTQRAPVVSSQIAPQTPAAEVVPAPQVEVVNAPTVAVVPAPLEAIKASDFHDVTGLPEESLAAASRALNMSEAQLRDIREQQQALKALGLFPSSKEEALS